VPDPECCTKIGILGANVPMTVIEESLKKFGAEPVYLNHCLVKSYLNSDLMKTLKDDGISEYAAHFLEVNRCPRTDDETYKESIVEEIMDGGFSGIIVNVLKFCDYQPFDYHYYQRKLDSAFPMLQIEHELTSSSEGQLATRIEAFMEGIKGRLLKRKRATARNGGRYFVGIDSGSHATKLVCIDKDYSIVAREVVPTGTSVRKSAEDLLERLKSGNQVEMNDVGRVVATGYGRNKIEIADDIITEISCHGLGVHHLLGKAGTIIDIGGQDSKAIKIDGRGAVIRFAMNDKCAAGTGRFLEVMANKLEMSLDDFSLLALKAKKHVAISSMCSVFAESEVISLIASGCSKEEIAKGIHRSIAERTIALAKRIDGEPPYYMAGGVAQNAGLVQELEESLGETLKVIDYPQFSGALGAAIMALREVHGN